jgi:energy-coupling factor transport system ATP-binding protein
MIELSNVSVCYGTIPALKEIDLNVAEGECVLVTGPSRCGKSTLARVLNGLIPHSIPAEITGEARVEGLSLIGTQAEAGHVARVAQKVGAVFQNPSTQLFHLNVEDEVAFGPRNLGYLGSSRAAGKDRAERARLFPRDRLQHASGAAGIGMERLAQPVDAGRSA